MKDIAKAAGVSHGTVSNVLNGKGNVSLEKIRLIEETAKRLGYRINTRARSLRAGNTNTVSLILPNILSEPYAELYTGVERTLASLGFRTLLYTTEDIQHNEINILKEVDSDQVNAIISVSCLTDANEYYQNTKIPPENIVFVYRNLSHSVHFAGFDYIQAGEELAAAIHRQGFKNIGLFTGPDFYSCDKDFSSAFIHRMKQRDPSAIVRKISEPLYNSYSKAFEFFEGPSPDVILTSDMERARHVRTAAFLGSAKEPPLIYSLSSGSSRAGNTVYQYHLDDRLLGRQIAEHIVDTIKDNKKTATPITVQNRGFLFQFSDLTKNEPLNELTILTIPSPSTRALKKLLPYFKKLTGIDVLLAIHSFEEIYEILTDIDNNKHYDIIRMDMASLPWFAKSTLRPLSDFQNDIHSLVNQFQLKDKYSLVDGVPYALPFDPSILMLFYRKDLFEDAAIKRMFYEQYKMDLEVPTDFECFNRVSRFFTQSINPESPTLYGNSVTFGNTEIIAAEFLTRYYSEGGQLILSGQRPSLTKDMAAAALHKYIEMIGFADTLSAGWWDESISSFAEGKTAMMILFNNHFSKMVKYSPLSSHIGYAPVPGNKPLLGGGVLGVSKYCSKESEVTHFLNWVYSDEISEQITLLGGVSANETVYQNQMVLDLYPWLATAHESSLNGIRETSFRTGEVFNYRMVERIIGRGIKNVINHIMTIEEAIDYINQCLIDVDVN
ncbi:extracellular solute-binding protein [Paenibacillus sp. J2TS4]|uniref:extracellular solute-binding protein n=1 Tax=Paenibacillus sp. J2TS4 TaxID=2807194 RepID=UPI0020C07E93|nr:extracellular solute-binding protein [Paenibacillus sp. J2TS4]